MPDAATPEDLTDLPSLASACGLDEAEFRRRLDGLAASAVMVPEPGWCATLAAKPSKPLEQALAERLASQRRRLAADDGLSGPVDHAVRLATLRAELRRRDLAGFVVPRSDAHQGEYVARSDERLAWLTGFTGSAGATVVLEKTAAIFVDGRYTLQARGEVPPKLYAHCHIAEEPPSAWIADSLPAGARFGYDPWLHTPAQAQQLGDAVTRAGGTLVAVDGNPIDAVWHGRAPAPMGPVFPQLKRYAGEGAADKRRRVAGELAEGDAAAAVITLPDSLAWLLNVRGRDVPFSPLALGFAILHADASVELFMDTGKLPEQTRRHLGDEVRLKDIDGFGPALDALGAVGSRVRVARASVPHWVVRRLELAGATPVNGDDPCQLPKACKNDVELDGTRAAHRRDGAALARFLCWLDGHAGKGTVTELQAADILEDFRREGELFRGLSFPTISGSGPNGAIVHYRVTPESDRRLGKGDLYLVDSGAQYLDGTTDVTRTVAIGSPSAEMRRHYTLVLKGHVAVATARFPWGTNGQQLDTLARAPLWEAGLDYDHGTGHGVGSHLGVHEGPQRISKAAGGVALEPGMVVSNEPGYYKEGAYGIRIENLVAVREPASLPKGAERELLEFETLTLAPFDRRLIDRRLLDEAEVRWIDGYHKRVAKEIGPLVDPETRTWLKAATAPLGGRT